MTIPAYSLHDVTFSYGERTVLEIEHLEIAEAEMVVLVGPNGSGKTTLLHLLAFLETPQTGAIKFFGKRNRHKRCHRPSPASWLDASEPIPFQ